MKVFVTHNPEDLAAYFGRALPELSAIADVVLNPLDRDLSTPELIDAAAGCDVIVAHRSTPGEPELFFDTRAVPGRPDGGTVDADGCYWQAGIEGWQLYRITPEGKVDMTIDVPIEKPSKPMFGGRNLDTLYVTSLGIGLSGDRPQPEAGSLFAVTGLGITGVPETRFAG